MDSFGFIGTLRALPGKRDELAAILLQAAQQVATAKGCRMYIVSNDVNDENCIRVFEVWDSREDHDNALKTPDTITLISKAMPLLSGKPEGIPLQILGGKGLEYL